MRLSTDPGRDEPHAVQVIHAALDAGVTLLDTADAYCLDQREVGHNERLIAAALASWRGDRSRIRVATKGGLIRPGGRWVPDGRAKHLRTACDASRRALRLDVIDLYQLHAVDPKTPLTTSVRALAALRQEGKIREIGLCNVTVGQIETARAIAEIASVQVSLSMLDVDALRNGVAEYCRDHGIRLIAYRSLGGDRRTSLARDKALHTLATSLGVSVFDVALAWLLDLDPCVQVLVGATRIESARSLEGVGRIRLTDDDRARLDAHIPAGRSLRIPMTRRRPSRYVEGEVVLVMGIPGAGKSTVARDLVARGYDRLNRDSLGSRSRLADLVSPLAEGLAAGRRRWVLDNTYPTRKSRNAVIECAWRHGIPVRCVWLTTSKEDAQINAVRRLVETHGRLPSPEEIHEWSRSDPTAFGPDAQFRHERALEPPVLDEGFTTIEEIPFKRTADPTATNRAVLLEYDGILCTSVRGGNAIPLTPSETAIPDAHRDALVRYHQAGWTLLGMAWRPQVEEDPGWSDGIAACFTRTRELLGVSIDLAYCPHPAGRPICWCRKPLPGLAIQFFMKHRIAAHRSILVGRSRADQTLARRLGMDYRDGLEFVDQP